MKKWLDDLINANTADEIQSALNQFVMLANKALKEEKGEKGEWGGADFIAEKISQALLNPSDKENKSEITADINRLKENREEIIYKLFKLQDLLVKRTRVLTGTSEEREKQEAELQTILLVCAQMLTQLITQTILDRLSQEAIARREITEPYSYADDKVLVECDEELKKRNNKIYNELCVRFAEDQDNNLKQLNQLKKDLDEGMSLIIHHWSQEKAKDTSESRVAANILKEYAFASRTDISKPADSLSGIRAQVDSKIKAAHAGKCFIEKRDLESISDKLTDLTKRKIEEPLRQFDSNRNTLSKIKEWAKNTIKKITGWGSFGTKKKLIDTISTTNSRLFSQTQPNKSESKGAGQSKPVVRRNSI